MALTDDVSAYTLQSIRADVMDSLFRNVPWLEAAGKSGSIHPAKQMGGRQVLVPIEVKDHTIITDLVSDDVALPGSHSNIAEDASYLWSHGVGDVVAGIKELSENQSPEGKVDLLERRVQNVMRMMRTSLNDRVVGNTGSGFSECASFNGMTVSNSIGKATNGIFESATSNPTTTSQYGAGGQDNTVGGISKSTYPQWNTQWATAGASFSTLGRSALSLLISDCQKYNPTGERPHLILMSSQAWSLLRAALSPTELYSGAMDVKEFGYGKLIYDGVPVDYDHSLDAQNAVGATTDLISAYVLDLKALQLLHLPGCWFDLQDAGSLMGGRMAGIGKLIHTAVAVAPNLLGSSGVLVNGQA